MCIFQAKGDCSLERFMYGGDFMLANQFQLMIHYSLMHFLWSRFQVIVMKQESADTVLSAWSKLAFGWPAVFRANVYCERKSSPLDFRFYYCHNLLTLYLLQMDISRLKLNASIPWKQNSCILQCSFHWSNYFPFWKLKDNKNSNIKCSVAKLLDLL